MKLKKFNTWLFAYNFFQVIKKEVEKNKENYVFVIRTHIYTNKECHKKNFTRMTYATKKLFEFLYKQKSQNIPVLINLPHFQKSQNKVLNYLNFKRDNLKKLLAYTYKTKYMLASVDSDSEYSGFYIIKFILEQLANLNGNLQKLLEKFPWLKKWLSALFGTYEKTSTWQLILYAQILVYLYKNEFLYSYSVLTDQSESKKRRLLALLKFGLTFFIVMNSLDLKSTIRPNNIEKLMLNNLILTTLSNFITIIMKREGQNINKKVISLLVSNMASYLVSRILSGGYRIPLSTELETEVILQNLQNQNLINTWYKDIMKQIMPSKKIGLTQFKNQKEDLLKFCDATPLLPSIQKFFDSLNQYRFFSIATKSIKKFLKKKK